MIRSLRTPAEFRDLRATGRRVSAGPLTMIVSPVDDPAQTRVAYAINRRVGTAVQRNRLRRRLRALLADLDRNGTLRSSAYLVICDPAAAPLSSGELMLHLNGVLQVAGRS